MTRTQTRFYAIFALLGMGLVLLTHLVRPGLVNPQPWISFILGVLPNFGAGLGLPFVLLVIALRVLQNQKRPLTLRRIFLFCALVSLIGLTAWEFTGGTIDAFDLLATLIAVICASIAFMLYPVNR